MQNIYRINSLFTVRLKSYFFKGLESVMLLKDSDDDLFFRWICGHFSVKLGQILDQNSGFSHNSYFKDKRIIFSDYGLTTLSQIFIQLPLHTHFFCQKLVYKNHKKKKTLGEKLRKHLRIMLRLVHLMLNNIYNFFSFCLFVVLFMVAFLWYNLLLMFQSMPCFHLKPGHVNAISISRFYFFQKKHNQLLFNNILSIILSQNLEFYLVFF